MVESMLNSAFRERSYFAIQEIARNYFRIRKYDKAEEYMKKALDSLPDMPTEAKHELQSDLSILYTEIGKHEEAEQLITELKVVVDSFHFFKMISTASSSAPCYRGPSCTISLFQDHRGDD